MSQETLAMLSTYGPLVAVMILFYFMLYRPQKAEQQRRKEMLDNLKEKYGVIITPDRKADGAPENLGDIMIEMDLANTFMLTAKTDPEVLKSKTGDTIHPENMRNNDGAEYSFNPHVFSSYYLKEHGETRRDAFFSP